MEEMNEALDDIREEVRRVLAEEPRLTTEEVAARIEKGEGVVRTVMESMYTRGDIEPLYVYRLVGE